MLRFALRATLLLAVASSLAFVGGASALPPNGPSPDIVISQVYGGGGNSTAPYNADFVELFNRGSSSQSLAGWSVQYASATGTGNLGSNSGQLVALPSASIPAGGYFLVGMSAGTNGSALTPDATGTINLSASAGKVALADQPTTLGCNGSSTPCDSTQAGHIVDLVGYGTGASSGANFYEGSAAAPTLSNTTADFRAADGCTDTDSNSDDFTADAPAPRNSSTALAPCSGGGGGDTAPSVTSTSPASGATGVAASASVTVTFNEPVTADSDAFSIACVTSGTHTAAVSGGPTAFTLQPDTAFSGGEDCTVTVSAGAIHDAASSQTMASDYSFSFTVESPPPPPTVLFTSPADGTSGVVSSNVSVTFSEPVTVDAGAFSIACATSGTHPATVSGGPTTFTLRPASAFSVGESCSVTVSAGAVHDAASSQTMASDYSFSFTVDPAPSAACQLGNGVTHVIDVVFDNVHFNRDNPNVLSDIEQMPALYNFITSSGTMLSNNHTPLIGHTANDLVTNFTGLYGDRQGMGVANNYYAFTPSGDVTPEQGVFNYWTSGGAGDGFPQEDYSSTVPPVDPSKATPPAPWVPFTRAGCDVGGVSTINMELENVDPDLQNVFGAGSPEVAQANADSDSYKDQESNDYIGLAVHCAQGDSLCADAQAVKYGQTTPSNTAVADSLPDEPGGYTGYQALFGHKYLQPILAGAANAGGDRTFGNGDSFPVVDTAGNLTDLNGTELDGQYAQTPGFPGFGPITAAQTLSYVADMQESGVPVTYAYISDVHAVASLDTGPCSPASTYKGNPDVGYADGPGDPCYYQTTAAYNAAFATFLKRLADDGITPQNTEFVFGADEGDHFSGANVGRAETPTCSGTPLTTSYTCNYAVGQVGEVQADVHGLLSYEEGDTTPFANEPQGNSVYVTGNQSTSTVRQLERDFGKIQVNDPFDGAFEPAIKWMADPAVEALLHFDNADPARNPTFTAFPIPDVYFTDGTSDSPSDRNPCTADTAPDACSYVSSQYAWMHGYYAPEINNTWAAFVGPGVKHIGVDGSTPGQGPSSAYDANSGKKLDTQIGNSGTWADQADVQPTLMALTGLKDDYVPDGRVLTEDMTSAPGKTRQGQYARLAICYKQLNSSVGQFGTDLLVADTAALATGSASSDSTYTSMLAQITSLGSKRDTLATTIKRALFDAAFNDTTVKAGGKLVNECQDLLQQADALANGGSQGKGHGDQGQGSQGQGHGGDQGQGDQGRRSRGNPGDHSQGDSAGRGRDGGHGGD